MATRIQVVFDCADPAAQAEFWAAALGYVIPGPPPGCDTWEDFARMIGIPEERWGNYAAIEDPDGVGPRVFFQKVPEPKTSKNRVHLDVSVGSRDMAHDERRERVRAAADRLVDRGATEVATFDEPEGHWIVMLDPESNEFCVH